MLDRRQLLALLAIFVPVGCGAAEPEPAPTPAAKSAPTAASEVEPAPTPSPEPAVTPTPTADPALAPQPAAPAEVALGETRLELGWSYQLSTKKRLEDAKAIRDQLATALAGNPNISPPYVLKREQFYLVMAGQYPDENRAKLHFDQAKAGLGQGGFIRSMREYCPGQRHIEVGVLECVPVDLAADDIGELEPWAESEPGRDPELAPEPAPAPAPFVYPEPTGPDPAPIQHSAASQIMVIASNRGYTPGKAGVDRDAKFRTFIWRPALGALPDKGRYEPPPPPAEGELAPPALVEELSALLVSDGGSLWQIDVEQGDTKFPLCECAVAPFGDDYQTNKSLTKRLVELRAHPYPSGDSTVLIGLLDFPNKHAADCIEVREDVDHVIQVQAVAGSQLLVVERNVQQEPCLLETEGSAFIEDTRRQRVFDLAAGASPVPLSQLEAEFPYAVIKDARFAASAALAKASDGLRNPTPTELLLTGVFPRYREFQNGVRVVLQYSVAGDGEVGTWGTDFDSHIVTNKYPASSSLAAPASVEPLMQYVQREYNSWKVIGWSLHEPKGQ